MHCFLNIIKIKKIRVKLPETINAEFHVNTFLKAYNGP